MHTRLTPRDEWMLRWYVDISEVEVSGLRSGLGPALDQARTQIMGHDSEPVTERMIDAAKTANVIRRRLTRCGKHHARVLCLAYTQDQDRELGQQFCRLANLAPLTETARTEYRRAKDRKRAKGRVFLEWLRLAAKNDVELRTGVGTEASQLLTQAVIAWEAVA